MCQGMSTMTNKLAWKSVLASVLVCFLLSKLVVVSELVLLPVCWLAVPLPLL